MKNFVKIAFMLQILLSGCSHHQVRDARDEALIKGECVQSFEEGQRSLGKKILNKSKEMLGKTASYLITGLGYSTDVSITFAGGIAVATLLCSPVLVLEASFHGKGEATGECIKSMVQNMKISESPTHIGDEAYQRTAKWRCPDLDAIAQGLRQVSYCYEAKGKQDLALEQIKSIRQQPFFMQCLSYNEKNILENEFQRLSHATMPKVQETSSP